MKKMVIDFIDNQWLSFNNPLLLFEYEGIYSCALVYIKIHIVYTVYNV